MRCVSQVGGAKGVAPSNADEWLAEATRRWGARVADVACEDWEAYVKSRISRPPPPSPMELLQEFYAHDPWQLLVACVLMSRVSSWNTKHTAISGFFAQWPTPSAVLDAEPASFLPVMKPLGLFENRLRSLIAVSEKFLSMPVFDIGLDKERKIYGIGEFGYSSYLIFCRYGTKDGGAQAHPSDSTLQALVRWLKSQSGGVKDTDEDESEESEEESDEEQAPAPALAQEQKQLEQSESVEEEASEQSRAHVEEELARETKLRVTGAESVSTPDDEEESIATRGRRNRRRCTLVKSEVPSAPSPRATNSKRKRAVRPKAQSKARTPEISKAEKKVKQEHTQEQEHAQPPAKKQRQPTNGGSKAQDIRSFFGGTAPAAAASNQGAVAPSEKAGKTALSAGQADIRSFFGGK